MASSDEIQASPVLAEVAESRKHYLRDSFVAGLVTLGVAQAFFPWHRTQPAEDVDSLYNEGLKPSDAAVFCLDGGDIERHGRDNNIFKFNITDQDSCLHGATTEVSRADCYGLGGFLASQITETDPAYEIKRVKVRFSDTRQSHTEMIGPTKYTQDIQLHLPIVDHDVHLGFLDEEKVVPAAPVVTQYGQAVCNVSVVTEYRSIS